MDYYYYSGTIGVRLLHCPLSIIDSDSLTVPQGLESCADQSQSTDPCMTLGLLSGLDLDHHRVTDKSHHSPL